MNSITLLITTFNRATLLERSLRRLILLGTLPDEVLVVDDGSADHTAEVCKAFESKLPMRYVYRHFPVYDDCSVPRNIGLKLATHEWIVTSEPELLFVTDALSQIKARLTADARFVLTQGVVYHMGVGTPWTDLAISNPAHVLSDVWDVRPYPDHFVANYPPETVTRWTPVSPWLGVFHRDWLMEIGGWDEDFARVTGAGGAGYAQQDIDLLTRLRIKGHNQIMASEIEVLHQWHNKDGADLDGVWKNEEIIKRKHLTESPDDPNLVANRGREWGRLICTDRAHPFCAAGLHCRVCESGKNDNGHVCV